MSRLRALTFETGGQGSNRRLQPRHPHVLSARLGRGPPAFRAFDAWGSEPFLSFFGKHGSKPRLPTEAAMGGSARRGFHKSLLSKE